MTFNNNPNQPQQGGSYDSYPSAPDNGNAQYGQQQHGQQQYGQQAPTGYDQQQYGNQPGYGNQPASKVKSIISLVLGIISVLSCIIPLSAWLTGIAGLVLGILGSRTERPAKGLWLTGIILSAIGIVLGTVLFILALMVRASGSY